MKRISGTDSGKLNRLRSVNKRYAPMFIATVVLVILAIAVSVFLTIRYTRNALNVHAAEGAGRAHTHLTAVFDNGFELLDSMAEKHLEADASGRVLKNISYCSFAEAFSNYHLMTISENRYIAYGDGKIRLALQYEPGKTIMGEIDSSRIMNALNSVFSSEYGYALFDTRTGIFILNNTFLQAENYYDSLLELNNSKAVAELLKNQKAQVRIKAPEAGSCIIAQDIDKPCGLVLVIPLATLENASNGNIIAMMPGLVGMLILIIAMIISSILSSKYALSLFEYGSQRVSGWKELAEIAAQRGNLAIFGLKCRGKDVDELFYFFNSLPMPEDDEISTEVTNLEELENRLRVDSAESGKLAAVISGMKNGDYVETDVHCILPTGVQCLHFELHRIGGSMNNVIGCVYDCTEDERLRLTEVSQSEFIEYMRPRSEYIWHINAVRNTWKAVYSRNSRKIPVFGDRIDVKRAYDEDLRELLREYFHPDDYSRFLEMMTSDALKKALNEGKTELRADYRVTPNKGAAWMWIRFVIRIWKNANTRDIKADVFAINVNEQKKAEIERRERSDILSRSLTAVNGMFFGLFYVNVIDGMCYSAKPYRGETGTTFMLPFNTVFSKYIEDFVHPDDRKAVHEIVDLWHIRKTMVEDTHLMQLRYRSLMGDTYYWSLVSIQAAQFENASITKVVVSLQHLHRADTTREIAEKVL